MRFGDWVVTVSLTLNVCAMMAYAWQGHWPYVLYFLGAVAINSSIIWGLR